MTHRGNGREHQTEPSEQQKEPRRDRARAASCLCLDICPSIRGIFTRLATASAVFTYHLVTILNKKTAFSCLSKAHSSIVICIIQVPNLGLALIKNCFVFRRFQLRLLPRRSATLSRILTLRLLISYIYGAPSKARNANIVYIWTYVWQR